jgi:hypothetical protein
MEGMLGTVVLALVGIWYFGGVINAIVAKSGKMAEREYQVFEREQAFRVAKSKEDLKSKIEKFQSESKSKISDEEMDSFLGI